MLLSAYAGSIDVTTVDFDFLSFSVFMLLFAYYLAVSVNSIRIVIFCHFHQHHTMFMAMQQFLNTALRKSYDLQRTNMLKQILNENYSQILFINHPRKIACIS